MVPRTPATSHITRTTLPILFQGSSHTDWGNRGVGYREPGSRDPFGIAKACLRFKGPWKVESATNLNLSMALILTYRRTLQNVASKKNKDTRFALAQHMCDMFVSVYSGLFRPSSSMWLNWLKDKVFELFGKDYRITRCIGTLKTELDYVCSSPALSPLSQMNH
jgi:hypothetical protein